MHGILTQGWPTARLRGCRYRCSLPAHSAHARPLDIHQRPYPTLPRENLAFPLRICSADLHPRVPKAYRTLHQSREDLSAPHPALHRPDLRARANFHDILTDRTPLYHFRRLPLLQIALRFLLHKRTLCPRRRPRPCRGLSSRARLSSCHRLAPRMHPRSPPAILRQPCRPFRRQVLHSLG